MGLKARAIKAAESMGARALDYALPYFVERFKAIGVAEPDVSITSTFRPDDSGGVRVAALAETCSDGIRFSMRQLFRVDVDCRVDTAEWHVPEAEVLCPRCGEAIRRRVGSAAALGAFLLGDCPRCGGPLEEGWDEE